MTAIIPIPAFVDNYIRLRIPPRSRRRQSRAGRSPYSDRRETIPGLRRAEGRAWKNAY